MRLMWLVEAMGVEAFWEKVGEYMTERLMCVFAIRRDFGGRQDRQKARLMWLVEAMGVDAVREKIGEDMGVKLRTAVEEKVRRMQCRFSLALVMLPHQKAFREGACICDRICIVSPCHVPIFDRPGRT